MCAGMPGWVSPSKTVTASPAANALPAARAVCSLSNGRTCSKRKNRTKSDQMRKYVIVGSGAAGISAVETIRAKDPEGSIHVISEDPFFYYSRPGLAYLLSGEIHQKMLYPKQDEEYRQLKLRITHSRAVALNPPEHIITLQNGERIPYDRLLIATGAGAFRPPLPGIDLEGVVKLDSLEDAQKILKFARRGKQAVVVGGGITSLELVEGLSRRGLKVSYIMRDDRYWKNVLDETESQIIEHRLEED
ncbi:MAG: NAD(P)/FAD-dependent oxidoreductase, partial [Chloroflexi bacterium]